MFRQILCKDCRAVLALICNESTGKIHILCMGCGQTWVPAPPINLPLLDVWDMVQDGEEGYSEYWPGTEISKTE